MQMRTTPSPCCLCDWGPWQQLDLGKGLNYSAKGSLGSLLPASSKTTACAPTHSPLCRGSSHLVSKTKEKDTSQQGCNCGGMPGNYRQIASATQVTVITEDFKVFVKKSTIFIRKNTPL